ncbi:MAG TPA: HD domain-containing protein [Gemmatimonadaceae bacterium]
MVREKEMMTRGYSDAINHAFAFAAKHHDRQVRKGTRAPYLTQPANVAVILARYDREESEVVAGILHDVVQDWVREGYTRDMLDQRIGEKFGAEELAMVLTITQRKVDDDGIEMSLEERREDILGRLDDATESALWVFAADKVHTANSLLSDLRRTVDRNVVWSRTSGGRSATVKWYRDICDRLSGAGFNASIMDELRGAVDALEGLD